MHAQRRRPHWGALLLPFFVAVGMVFMPTQVAAQASPGAVADGFTDRSDELPGFGGNDTVYLVVGAAAVAFIVYWFFLRSDGSSDFDATPDRDGSFTPITLPEAGPTQPDYTWPSLPALVWPAAVP